MDRGRTAAGRPGQFTTFEEELIPDHPLDEDYEHESLGPGQSRFASLSLSRYVHKPADSPVAFHQLPLEVIERYVTCVLVVLFLK